MIHGHAPFWDEHERLEVERYLIFSFLSHSKDSFSPMLEHLGPWAILGPLWTILGHLETILGLSWSILRHLGAISGTSWELLKTWWMIASCFNFFRRPSWAQKLGPNINVWSQKVPQLFYIFLISFEIRGYFHSQNRLNYRTKTWNKTGPRSHRLTRVLLASLTGAGHFILEAESFDIADAPPADS